MAHQVSIALATLILASILWTGATAQSNNCSTVIITLTPCLNYTSSNSSAPTTECCTNLGTVVQSSPQCLCQLNGTASLGSSINQTRVLALPAACNVSGFNATQCNGTSLSPNTTSGVGSDMFHRRQLAIGWLFLCYFAFPL